MKKILLLIPVCFPLLVAGQINVSRDSAFLMTMPDDTSQFTRFPHNKPVSQGYTGTCWCFGAVSMIESEIFRQSRLQVKLSEMYLVYWEYVEKAKRFVKEKGNSAFTEASEANAVPRMMKLYGIVPANVYSGLKTQRMNHYHTPMVTEMQKFLGKVREKHLWNEEKVNLKIRSILDKYMGRPPDKLMVDDLNLTPLQYMTNVLKFDPDDYFSFMSTNNLPFNRKGELVEEDNWWHDRNYYNIHLDDFIAVITAAMDKGYTLTICGDISEPGRADSLKVSVVPYFDIAPRNISEDSRQFRMDNKTTTDDHCMHLIGYYKNISGTWFLVKDSGRAFFGKYPGYWFLHEDYIRLKMMTLLVNKYAAGFILNRIIK